MDPDLRFDLLFYRLRARLEEHLRELVPEVIHLIGPGELGILGAIAVASLRISLVTSDCHESEAGPSR